MKVLVLVAHPNRDSFNHAIAAACSQALTANGHEVVFHDLYREAFDPLMSREELQSDAVLPKAIQRYCEELSHADGIVVVHPNWWGQPPAILKGWIDRVFRLGVAYEFQEGDKGEGVPLGLLRAKCALVFNTSNTASAREESVFGDPLELIWRNCVFGLCGVPTVHRRTFNIVVSSSQADRRKWLSEVKATTDKHFPGTA